MKLIVVLGSIVTIILVTLPAFRTVRISADEREDEYYKLQTVRLNISRTCNYNFASIFRDFVLNEFEMYDFADHFILTNEKPEWSKSRMLENPELYKLLRFHKHVDTIPSNADEMVKRLTELKQSRYSNSPNVNIVQICFDYMGEQLHELISLENYFALRILEEDYNQLEHENMASWGMKKALFSLALRQYIPMNPYSFSPIYCKAKHLRPKSFILNFRENSHFQTDNFWLCSSKDFFPEQLSGSSIESMNDHTLYWIFYSIQINDPKQLIYLEDVIKSNNEKLYFLLPQTIFTLPNVPEVYNTDNGLVVFLNIKTSHYRKTSIWLAKTANQIELYEKKEIDDIQQFFKFLEDEEFDFLNEMQV